MIVETDKGKTGGTLAGYVKWEPRLQYIRDKFVSGEVDENAVHRAVSKIFGYRRALMDTKEAAKDIPKEKGLDHDRVEREAWESWLEDKPREYRKVYHSPDVVAEFVIKGD